MDVVDTEKLETALIYLQRITEGNNPVNNMPADEDSVINNPNVLRCMLFVKEVLEELKRNDGYIGRRPRKSDLPSYPLVVLEKYQYTGDKTITKFVDQLNDLVDIARFKKLTYKPIVDWLKKNGYLEDGNIEGRDSKCTMVTEKGQELGIKSEIKTGFRKEKYTFILYGKTAQEFIVSKLDEII